ncbi:MAG: hypothetical protein ACD_2C00073G0027 [uncultured bacterium (gcode 4)]|uniref:Uncharacterized protein n=1 Tax=uncultured bacterium (gcode 4) TaxID=1234023 RepID=K2GHK0_9BACT|nr:MAG: hypothetical protein ACD_2C00073G0027 [uncultured bacterium (gcode 4)]
MPEFIFHTFLFCQDLYLFALYATIALNAKNHQKYAMLRYPSSNLYCRRDSEKADQIVYQIIPELSFLLYLHHRGCQASLYNLGLLFLYSTCWIFLNFMTFSSVLGFASTL